MLLRDEECYAALRAHDPRFDGQFFVGVSSTGIYCRPICAVRTPRREHCRFFPSAAAAEHGGYRPCLRCRPELAPGNSSVDAARRLAQGAASLIEDGYLTDGSLDALADRMGVTGRHLRRVFTEEFGVAPVDYAQTQRLLLAKRLLTDTRVPVIDVAMASGFGSLRRFNALFRDRYRLRPTEIRRSPEAAPRSELAFDLGYRPPFAWDALLEFLGTRAMPGVEAVERGVWRRTAAINRDGTVHTGWVSVERARKRQAIRVTVSGSLAKVIPAVLSRVKRVFDLACRPDEVADRLGPLAAEEPGLRVPGAFDGFEQAVRAVLGQQVTVGAARTMAGRMASALGQPTETPYADCVLAFPSAERVVRAGAGALGGLGIVGTRARAIHALAIECARGRLVLDPGSDVQKTIDGLLAIPGIGDWTVQYIAMRALAWPDGFPHTDYGVRKALGTTSASRALTLAEKWRPWRAYATVHLWRRLETRIT